MAGGPDFVGQEPVAELGVITMSVVDGIGQPRLIELGVAERGLEPPVVLLTAQPKHPARNRDRDGVGRQLAYYREEPFGSRLACDK